MSTPTDPEEQSATDRAWERLLLREERRHQIVQRVFDIVHTAVAIGLPVLLMKP
ncbi:hypothetical protein ACFWOG_03390 [Kitasatospora sp. NPDC058406]|uniref:hypothetical protein n=1 Tax=Kitasatospora sp. NPDC058406 TaxID=3346483 RepID=UPI003657CCA6